MGWPAREPLFFAMAAKKRKRVDESAVIRDRAVYFSRRFFTRVRFFHRRRSCGAAELGTRRAAPPRGGAGFERGGGGPTHSSHQGRVRIYGGTHKRGARRCARRRPYAWRHRWSRRSGPFPRGGLPRVVSARARLCCHPCLSARASPHIARPDARAPRMSARCHAPPVSLGRGTPSRRARERAGAADAPRERLRRERFCRAPLERVAFSAPPVRAGAER